MDTMTVKEFVSYLDENAELEDDADYEYIDGKVVKCKVYDLKETNSSLHKEFLVTEDERLFYWLSLLQKVELVDCEEEKDVYKRQQWSSGIRSRKNHHGSIACESSYRVCAGIWFYMERR